MLVGGCKSLVWVLRIDKLKFSLTKRRKRCFTASRSFDSGNLNISKESSVHEYRELSNSSIL